MLPPNVLFNDRGIRQRINAGAQALAGVSKRLADVV
jgi:hypothetical protein